MIKLFRIIVNYTLITATLPRKQEQSIYNSVTNGLDTQDFNIDSLLIYITTSKSNNYDFNY